MEATLLTFPSSKPQLPSSSAAAALSLKSHFSNPFLRITHHRPRFSPKAPTLLKIQATISRAKKEEIVAKVKEQLHDCHLIAGIAYQGLTVKQFETLRNQLPETSKLMVAKNTLVFKAIEGTQFEVLKPCMKGMNAWLFVHSEEIPAALKPFREFQKEEKLENNDFVGAAFEGKFYGPQEFEALEKLPTRAELYARILGSLKGPASAVVGTIQAPARDLILLLKAYCKRLEDEGAGQ